MNRYLYEILIDVAQKILIVTGIILLSVRSDNFLIFLAAIVALFAGLDWRYRSSW